MHGDPGGLRVGDQHDIFGFVNKDLAWLALLREFFHRSVGLNLVHLLDLFLGLCGLNLTSVESELEVALLELV